MVELKVAQFPQKLPKNWTKTVFILKVMLFKKSNQFSRYLGYFWTKICCRELLKIAQSGRTAHNWQMNLNDDEQKMMENDLQEETRGSSRLKINRKKYFYFFPRWR